MTPPRGEPVSPDERVPAWVWLGLVCAAAAYIGYLGLLVTCDLLRVEPHGIVPDFGAGGVTVRSVQPGTPAAVAGIRPNDQVLRVNGQMLKGPVDWQWARVNTDPSKPLDIDVGRGDELRRMSLPLASGIDEWRTGASRSGLIAFRVVQIVTLGFALTVAFRRASQPAALLGAWLLASFATISLALPVRMFHVWRALPQPLEALLWIPYATSAATGPLLFAFFAVFPRRTLSRRALLIALTPGLLATAWFVHVGSFLFRPPGPPTGLPDLTMAIFAVGIVYALAAGGMLLVHHREAHESPTDQRRIRVLLGGLVLAVLSGGALLVLYGTSGGVDIFGNPLLTVLALIFLGGPASFAHAVLRHRLFGLRLIVRQGVRYALARRLLDALIPAAVTLLVLQLVRRRDLPLIEAVQSVWWLYALAIPVLILLRRLRERLLAALDKHFFRERYDANRLLENIVVQIKLAPDIETAAPSVSQQIDEALHPEFVDILRLSPDESAFTPVTTTSASLSRLPAALTAVKVLAELRRPLALSTDTSWLRHHVPDEERVLLAGHQIELLIPVFGEARSKLPVALIVLGPRRSEEPFNQDDLALLINIASALQLLMRAPLPSEDGFSECGQCGRCFERDAKQCDSDGSALTLVHGTRLLSGRYRLDRRLDRGGMGVVYKAADLVLERNVAVKLIHEHLLATPDAGGWIDALTRFRHEARAAARLSHPNIVRIYDFGTAGSNRPFLVMELLEGETLRGRLRGGRQVPAQEALALLHGVCSALSFAHERGLVHRDLKPENIFLHRDDRDVTPKVLDFGLVKAIDSARQSSSGESSAGLLLGTLDYMAPEQVMGGEVSPCWDIWALSVIAYEMLTGRHPFKHILLHEPGTGRTTRPLVARSSDHSLLEPLARFFDDALSPDPARRPGDAVSWLRAFERVLE